MSDSAAVIPGVHRILVAARTGADGRVAGSLLEADALLLADVRGLRIPRWRLHPAFLSAPGPEPIAQQVVRWTAAHQVQALVAGQVPPEIREQLASAGVAVFQREGVPTRIAAISAGTVLDLVRCRSGTGERVDR